MDHRALVVDIRTRPGEICCYVEERTKLPVQPPPPEEQTEEENIFMEFSAAVDELPCREQKHNK